MIIFDHDAWNRCIVALTRLSDCRIDRTIRKVYISFQDLSNISQSFSRPFCLDNSRAKKVPFPFNSSNDTLIVFLPCAS